MYNFTINKSNNINAVEKNKKKATNNKGKERCTTVKVLPKEAVHRQQYSN